MAPPCAGGYHVSMLRAKKPVPERPLRDELIEARDKLERQIEILRSALGDSRRPTPEGGSLSLIPGLEAQLGEIRTALEELGYSDAQGT